jgi:methionine synthase II (cobalamin-independent)
VHTCAPGTPLDLLRGAGARGLSVDLGVLVAADLDHLAEAWEAGETVVLGVVPGVAPGVAPADRPTSTQVTERVQRILDMLGLDLEEVSPRLLLSPACGLATATPDWVRDALRTCREAAVNLSG